MLPLEDYTHIRVFSFSHFKPIVNMVPVRNVDSKTRDVVVKLLKHGKLRINAGKTFSCSHLKILEKFIVFESVKNYSRPQRPPVISARRDHTLIIILKKIKWTTSNYIITELKKASKAKVSNRTLHNRSNEARYR